MDTTSASTAPAEIPAIPALQPVHFLGLRTEVKDNVCFVEDEEVVYPIGGALTIHNHPQKKQKFIKLPDRGYNVNALCVSPNRKVVAVADKGENPSIYIYDLTTLKRRRIIQMPAEKPVQTNCWECLCFTFDSRLLMAVLGEPDWTLVAIRWDKGKTESTTRANNFNQTGNIKQIACNPSDAGMVAVVGDVVFRLLTVTENVWRQYGYSKSESINFTCAAWLSQDKLITGTTDGRFFVIDSGDLKAIYHANELVVLDLQGKEDVIIQASASSIRPSQVKKPSEEQEIRALVAFSKGFVFSYGDGIIYLFEKETNVKYKKRNMYYIEPDALMEELNPDIGPSNKINAITVNPLQDVMVVSCTIPQLFATALWGPDLTRIPEIKLMPQGLALHRGAVRSLGVCKWKPVALTCGKDRTIKVWDYEREIAIMNKQYQEDIYSLDMHPTGLYAVVGFTSNLKYLTILIDDLTVTREIPIRYCSECKFSNHGHLFAAVNGNIIQVYSSVSFENLVNLKGHYGRITSLAWTMADYRLVSVGTEGAVYEWTLNDGKRLMECIIKTCKFTGCAVTSDGRTIYTVGSDGEVKEIVNGVVRTAQKIDDGGLNSIVLSNSNFMLFVSGRNGVIYSVKLPLKETKEYLEFTLHHQTCHRLSITFDDKFLISISKDNTLGFWKLVNTMGQMIKLDKSFKESEDILIPYNDLAEKIQTIKSLSVRVKELDAEHSYRMRQTEAQHNAKLKDIHEGYCIAIEELKDKNAQLIAEHTQEFHALTLELENTKRGHEGAMQELESTYNEKLIGEYDKFVALEDKMSEMRKSYEIELDKLRDAGKAAEVVLLEKFADQLKEKDLVIEELHEDIEQRVKEHEIIKQQIEDDADREIYELKRSHENELKDELETNIKIRAENGIYRKKVTAFQKEVDELKHHIFTLENEHTKFKAVILDLEKSINELKKEVTERDTALQDKEKKIHGLKRKNQELDKYKYVLEFEIENLKSQIEPRERKIHNQKEQIEDMVNELDNLQSVIETLELQLAELKEKLNGSQCEFKREKAKFRKCQELLKSMRIDLSNVSGLIQEPNKLKTAIKDMYHRYNADKEFTIMQVEDCDLQNEFQKQRSYLEKTIKGLKDASKKVEDPCEEKHKVMQESAELILETNALRQELKHCQKQNKKMSCVLGISTKHMLPREGQRKLAEASATKKTIHNMYLDRLQKYERTVMTLKEENKRLLMKLNPKKSKGVQTCPPDQL